MKLKVYISLPIQGKDIESQKKYAQDIALRIAVCGHEPVNPFDNFLPDDAPRTAHMKADISMLLDCNAIMMFTVGKIQTVADLKRTWPNNAECWYYLIKRYK